MAPSTGRQRAFPMCLAAFHPVVANWFCRQFAAPSQAQRLAWPPIQAGQPTLIAAPTGSGKTLAAFLVALDNLLKQGLAGQLAERTQVLYVSPLKALSTDVANNLEWPLAGIRQGLLEAGLGDVPIRAAARTGDTTAAERRAMLKKPPHVLVTTPESLYALLTSASGRALLGTVGTVIVDEIHALAANKRGAHLSLSLERLAQLTAAPPLRIGLSATQRPLEAIARFLTGAGPVPCAVIDVGHQRRRDLALELSGPPLTAVMDSQAWGQLYDRLAALAQSHRTTLVFVNTRRLAERAAAALAGRLGEEAVAAHHGSLAKEHRLAAERRLRQGQLRALVATASLELGIDIGDVDLVCQLGSPRNIGVFLQRVGRSGHSLEALPKGRLFPLSLDDLVECAALLMAVAQGELDSIAIPEQPLDVLAQHIVAEVACAEWQEEALYLALTRAWPYRRLPRAEFAAVVHMLAEGYLGRRGRRGAYLHRDAVHGRLRPRRHARLTAQLNGGAIPDQFDYEVILQPEGLRIGTVNEEFAFDSLVGDIFQLGNNAYRLLKVEQGRVHAESAPGLPPNIPFWFGEAPGRSDALSQAVSALREAMDLWLERGVEAADHWLRERAGLDPAAAGQLSAYLAAAKAALGCLPSRRRIVLERFFDQTGDQHLVIHSCHGARLNRAFGLALRKRFCRRFNFELQAAANDDSIVLSLGPTHSFPLLEPMGYLRAATVRAVLAQALLAAPQFAARWRWVANIALAVPRNRAGNRVPPQFQRNDAEDLLAVVFPEQLACFEHIVGDRAIPDHPLVSQTLADCLTELMDIDGLERLLAAIDHGQVAVVGRELTTPSPLAQAILNARPYAFLDDTPAEERRTRAVRTERLMTAADAATLGQLSPEAIAQVREEAWPRVGSADELHDALLVLGFLTAAEGRDWRHFFAELQQQRRAVALSLAAAGPVWVAAERLPLFAPLLAGQADGEAGAQALAELLLGRLGGLGPVEVAQLAAPLALPPRTVDKALLALQQQGVAMRGRFTANAQADQWCERGLLARIHQRARRQRRRAIAVASPPQFMRFLFAWHGVDEARTGAQALEHTLSQLEGLALPAASWETEVLPARVRPVSAADLDRLCATGQLSWLRLRPAGAVAKTASRTTAVSLVARAHLPHWLGLAPPPAACGQALSGRALKVHGALKQAGASFFADLATATGLLKAELADALKELVAVGLVTADTYQGLRGLIAPAAARQRRNGRHPGHDPYPHGGRWSLLPVWAATGDRLAVAAHIAAVLLRRYGVVCPKLAEQAPFVPPWRELLYALRRQEARGEVQAGRFVQGLAGEQYALPAAAAALAAVAGRGGDGRLMAIAAADPLNLTGILGPGPRVAAQPGRRLLYRDGLPLAHAHNGSVQLLSALDADERQAVTDALLGNPRAVGVR